MILVVVAIVVQLSLLFVRCVLPLRLLSSSFLFGIVNLVDVFVGFDQIDAQLSQWGCRWISKMRWYPGLHRPDIG
uniref:Putative secreted peptide n=1 Tax=Anopheles braziliensis TaxID=58242 RepID=A0A2M3ZS93_9DIPT